MLEVAEQIGRHMARELVVVTKSTVPVGTAAQVEAAVAQHAQHPFHVCSNPEFLKEGAAVDDFMKPDRVVLGVESDHARSVMAELYAPFVRTGKPIIFMDIASAEMTKYAANAMLATRISFMNEIANLCERVGANVDLVRKGIGSDARIGPSFLFPGPGYGGSCFPKDVQALIRTGREFERPLGVLEAVEAANERQKHRLFEKLRMRAWRRTSRRPTWRSGGCLQAEHRRHAGGAGAGVHRGGCSPRAPPSPPTIPRRWMRRGDTSATRITYAASNYDALTGADALVVVTDWNEYRHPDFGRIKAALRQPIIVDGRNLYDAAKLRSLGFRYFSIGRGGRMRVLITGAAGFLGSHLSDRFLADGHRVVGIDNFVTGNPDNIAHLMGRPDFEFFRHNVSTYMYVAGPVDGVLHFASPASPVDYLEHPIATLKVGALGTHNALGLAKAKGARFFLASTSEVYGDPLVHPQPESYWGNVNPIGPRGVYDEAKRFAEAMTMAYHRVHGLDTRIVRIFNTYGPRMRPHDGRVVSNFIIQALGDEPITIYGDGSQTRSFCYVDDEIDGIYRLFQHGTAAPTNIGNPDEYTVRQLAELVVALTGTSAPIQYQPLPVDDPKVRKPDISRARETLGWEPRVPLREGVTRTIEYFRSLGPGARAPRA